jgi:hypothetical protein
MGQLPEHSGHQNRYIEMVVLTLELAAERHFEVHATEPQIAKFQGIFPESTFVFKHGMDCSNIFLLYSSSFSACRLLFPDSKVQMKLHIVIAGSLHFCDISY